MIKTKNFAVFVDGENCSSENFPGILRKVQASGTIAVKRVYADWTNPARSSWKDILHASGARPIQQFAYGSNAADHALIMDAIEILVRSSEINAVCIASSDNDFQFLAQRIREMGKYVLGVGRRKSPAQKLIAACHEYAYYDDLPNINNHHSNNDSNSNNNNDSNDNGKTARALPTDEAFEALVIRAMSDDSSADDDISLSTLGTLLRRADPDYSNQQYGASSLKKLIAHHPLVFTITSGEENPCMVRLTKKTRQKIRRFLCSSNTGKAPV